jgi:UDP-GlcNAc:undecaprenyl-phosphate/decaprenyl-phosphate GlcNAc-1-phosphate transferase
MSLTLISIIVTFFFTTLAIVFLRKLALKIKLVDFPGQRKIHSGSVPLIGGLSMFIGIFFGLLIFPIDKDLVAYFIVSVFILVTLGSIDDYRNISVLIRFIFQSIAALIMILFAGVSIESIGNLNGTGEILLQKWALIFSMIAVIGSINAINMMDGIHGLAGGQSLISFLAISTLTSINNSYSGFTIAIVFCIALIPFLVENLCIGRSKDKRIFMGDAGSMMLGFGIVWLLVENSQGPNRSFAPVTALWIFSIPLMDFFATILRRLLKKQSPFKPDRGHLHHILIEKGLSNHQSLIIILVLTLVIAILGVIGELLMVSEWKMFYSFIALFLVYSLYTFYSKKQVNSYKN